ncbi:hypothetical protein KSK55_04965 [Methanospirillum purgamenti]|uniref:Uncharacterized protein n=1 Tax=Methanospirillum hungatei TaxID=2203 RepID=A0A8F5VME1_METHU|nr:hypothetical protein [Methanospirillum hungatei]QXO95747.1 hypothetical protein KSK55_04965 [Methanospirillum hungatei]
MQVSSSRDENTDLPPVSHNVGELSSPTVIPGSDQSSKGYKVTDQSFPPNMPPQLREQLIRQGRLPSSGEKTQDINTPLTHTPVPTPTSFVTRLGDTLSEDAFIPSRSSIYFSHNTSHKGPVNLYPVYTASGIPLNSTLKELKIHAEKGPFSVRYTVHPISTPLVSWARITVQDPFLNILHEDGYNREFSSEKEKEFFVYKEGDFKVLLSGGYATLDISINTPDGQVQPQSSGTKSGQEYPVHMPPQLRERLMREGRILEMNR